MSAKLVILAPALFILTLQGYNSYSQTSDSYYTLENNEKAENEPFHDSQLAELRLLHEGSVFLLKRYATMEALITAVENGRSENEGFWIGASSLIPGVGQMINHDYLQGGLLLFASTVSWGTVHQLEFTRTRQHGSDSILPLYYSSLVLRNGLMTYAMLHAANKNYRVHRDRTAAMWTGTASILPGVGQAINGDWWEASGLLIAWGFSTVLVSYCESALFTNGDEGYLVKAPEQPAWTVSWVPGGAALTFTAGW